MPIDPSPAALRKLAAKRRHEILKSMSSAMNTAAFGILARMAFDAGATFSYALVGVALCLYVNANLIFRFMVPEE